MVAVIACSCLVSIAGCRRQRCRGYRCRCRSAAGAAGSRRCRTRADRSSSPCSATSAPAIGRRSSWRNRWRRCTSASSTTSSCSSATTSTGRSGRRISRRSSKIPYKPLLDAGVKFYASLGNHDAREQRYYKLFNMDGKLYYTFSPKSDIRFFILESTYPEPEQIKWVEQELASSGSDWKIAVFHHPLYSSGDRHGSDLRLRDVLEPLFLKYNVSVVLTGHDHFYERVKPQKGIAYFVVGSGGQLREGNIDRSTGLTGRRIRHGSCVPGSRDRWRRHVFQRHFPQGICRRFRNAQPPAANVALTRHSQDDERDPAASARTTDTTVLWVIGFAT